MKKFIISLFLVLLFLVSCSQPPSESSIQTAIANTQAAYTPTFETINTPTPILTPTRDFTPTPIPLEKINLKDILVTENKLPQGYFATKTNNKPPYLSVPEPLNQIWQQLERENEVAGGVRIYLYESKLDVKKAYDVELETFESISESRMPIEDIGENAEMTQYTLEGTEVTTLVFYRCYATVEIIMTNMTQDDDILIYAGQLDKNIQEVICR